MFRLGRCRLNSPAGKCPAFSSHWSSEDDMVQQSAVFDVFWYSKLDTNRYEQIRIFLQLYQADNNKPADCKRKVFSDRARWQYQCNHLDTRIQRKMKGNGIRLIVCLIIDSVSRRESDPIGGRRCNHRDCLRCQSLVWEWGSNRIKHGELNRDDVLQDSSYNPGDLMNQILVIIMMIIMINSPWKHSSF